MNPLEPLIGMPMSRPMDVSRAVGALADPDVDTAKRLKALTMLLPQQTYKNVAMRAIEPVYPLAYAAELQAIAPNVLEVYGWGTRIRT